MFNLTFRRYLITNKAPLLNANRRLSAPRSSIPGLSSRWLSTGMTQTAREPFYRRTTKSIFRFTLLSTLAIGSYLTYEIYRESNPRKQAPQSLNLANGQKRKTLIILGSGWGSVSLLKNLDTSLYNVILISPRNYFLFTPLLPSTPVGTIELKSIIEPVRTMIKRCKGEVKYFENSVQDIDPISKNITLNDGKIIDYDYLVVGVGSKPTTFNIPGVIENSSFLKEISDAKEIKSKIFKNIELASALENGDPLRKKLLSFVVVGGGPTGVEFAAELSDYIQQDINKWQPELQNDISITLVEAAPNILPSFNKELIQYAEELLSSKGKIQLKLNTIVKEVDSNYLKGLIKEQNSDHMEHIPYGVLVWATGNAPRDICQSLMSKLKQQDSRRGLLINDKLQLLGAEDSIFAIGDCTFHPGLFPTAQVASQEGKYLANIFKRLHKIERLAFEKKIRKIEIPDFKYKYKGALAYIGQDKAIADVVTFGKTYPSAGSLTFYFWKSAYLTMLSSFRNKILVALDWTKVSMFGRNSSE
ncbi:hypothetical protein KAFR_0B05060 [Kazachstania africana CBS 2517]|uniref:NADH:ubiquinone reductase (non-electrogenic) n=1 Tax=Kazachstania africana (strain ATCC 22294 / BCRC 22015 / CBS 2517 / CECT 1963 / NBRC 1671 / NRRL Y-8276) TaxID=1071382 RepID=H2AR02_KAZAF|nr:hypothetical protein KAFR_0B05060 [Kazachstania africana CBS 2517]CCF56802.1 hypothetical protein KAFR_0B05060 [Kazachstania africana CBS 2517]